jgi:DNA repair protein RecO (recombination protein O)
LSVLTTDAIVLHAFDYRETSRILRLATRDAGVRSVIARGARRPNNRFGSALDLFAEGSAQIVMRGSGDLQTLAGFDVARARPLLAGRWERFAAANALSEILLRFARDDAQPGLFATYAHALDTLEQSEDQSADAGLAGAWGLVAELGFAPTLDACASCGTPLQPDATVRFSHRAGGALCDVCAPQHPGARTLPPDARATLSTWINDRAQYPIPDPRAAQSHLRLLREFLHEHLADDRPLRAFAVWEHGDWQPK